MCVVVCVFRPEVDNGCLPLSLSALLAEVGSLCSNSETADLVSLAFDLPWWGGCHHLAGAVT